MAKNWRGAPDDAGAGRHAHLAVLEVGVLHGDRALQADLGQERFLGRDRTSRARGMIFPEVMIANIQ